MVAQTDEIKKYLGTKLLIVGTNLVIKNLKLGRLSKVYLSSNCPAKIKERIAYYASLANTAIVELNIPNDELGVLCKKLYSISVLAILSESKSD